MAASLARSALSVPRSAFPAVVTAAAFHFPVTPAARATVLVPSKFGIGGAETNAPKSSQPIKHNENLGRGVFSARPLSPFAICRRSRSSDYSQANTLQSQICRNVLAQKRERLLAETTPQASRLFGQLY